MRDITSWVLDHSKETSILWVSAPAGSGKSAILQRVAEDFHDSGGLSASFFFSRTAIKRNTDTYFVSTLASQLATSIPLTRPFIENAIKRDPSIFEKILSEQMDHLVVYPLVYASLHPENGSPWPTLLVIDGLDECHGAEHQAEILRTLKRALVQLKSSLPTLCLLIASRPEPAIVTVFSDKLSDITRHIVLDDTYHPDRDIATFLRSSFYDIYHRRRHLFPSMASLPKPWPPEHVISFLVRKSSGQFIFAATVIRFIDVDRRIPTAQLQLILDICGSMDSSKFAAKPFGLLDELYSQVLNSSEERKRALSILGAMLFLANPEQSPTVNFLLPLLQIDPEDATIIFWDLHSIVHVPVSHDRPINFYHASFRDFLLDRHRAGNLFVDACAVHQLLLKMCIQALSARSRKRRTRTNSIEQYSTQHWLTHYLRGDDLNPGFLDKILEKSNLEIWLPKLRKSDSVSDFVSWWDDFAAVRGRFHSRVSVSGQWSLAKLTLLSTSSVIQRGVRLYVVDTLLLLIGTSFTVSNTTMNARLS